MTTAAPKMSSTIRVFCTQSDCLYYAPEPSNAAQCQCSHTDKKHHMDAGRCPLYRMDWQKKLKGAGSGIPTHAKPSPGARRISIEQLKRM